MRPRGRLPYMTPPRSVALLGAGAARDRDLAAQRRRSRGAADADLVAAGRDAPCARGVGPVGEGARVQRHAHARARARRESAREHAAERALLLLLARRRERMAD